MGKRKNKKKAFRNPEQGVEPTQEFQAKHALEKIKTDQGGYALRVRDKRPIDKYYRLYCIDADRGIGEHYRRGITEEQFRAADRLACNYERTMHSLSQPLHAVRAVSINAALYPVESIMHAIHQHTRVMKELSRGSQEIVIDICCEEKSLIDFEHRRGWRKGYGMIRLREALDELAGAFHSLGKRRSGHPFA